MRLYACFTPSHRPLLEQHFLPSLPTEFGMHASSIEPLARTSSSSAVRTIYDGERFCLAVLPQRSATGAFASDGFQSTCLDKVDFILDALKRETEPFLYSDVDVRFYGPVVDDLTKLLGNAAMSFQWDGARGGECTGFMVLRPTPQVKIFWERVKFAMERDGLMDQDAMHSAAKDLGTVSCPSGATACSLCLWHILPDRYWTFGRNDKHWTPGTPVNPPTDLLMHHANWTVGIENKLKLLDEVRRYDNARKGGFVGYCTPNAALAQPEPEEDARPVPRTEVVRMLEAQKQALTSHHHPLPLALVLQFWQGDKHEALELARLIADIEPKRRRDPVCLFFARQENCPMDAEIEGTMLYVGLKMPVADMVTKIDEAKQYPGVCYDAWASAISQLADRHYAGESPFAHAFFFEADGCPTRANWIDRLKAAHAETLAAGKLVTGARLRENDHINGSLVAGVRLWYDCPSLQRCPPRAAWDIFHGNALVTNSHPSRIICNEYGIHVTEELFVQLGREAAWITSVKDGSHHEQARRLLVEGGLAKYAEKALDVE